MAPGGQEKRRHTRLVSGGGTAFRFFGDKAEALPKEAIVLDVSESGARLSFTWVVQRDFPLVSGDQMGFHMRLTGSPEELNIIGTVRRVTADPETVSVGMEFMGLGEGERRAIRDNLQSLALSKLKSIRTTPRDGLAAVGPGAPPASAPAPEAPPPPAPAPPAPAPPAAAPPPAEAKRPKRRRKPYFGEILVSQGALTAEQLDDFLAKTYTGNRKLGEELREHGLVTEVQVAQALAEQARVPFVEITSDLDVARLAGMLPRLIFIEHQCIPVRTEDDGRVLVVAMARPPSLEDVEKLSQATDRRIRIAIAADSDVDRCLKKLYNVRRARAIEVARYQVRLEVAYRFVDKGWTEYVGGPSARGITGDVSRTGMKIVGPLPEGITKGRVEHEELQAEVRVRGLDDNAIRLACRPVRIDSGDRADIYTIGCIIEGFPEGEEAEWSRLMKQVSLQGFKPRPDRYEFE